MAKSVFFLLSLLVASSTVNAEAHPVFNKANLLSRIVESTYQKQKITLAYFCVKRDATETGKCLMSQFATSPSFSFEGIRDIDGNYLMDHDQWLMDHDQWQTFGPAFDSQSFINLQSNLRKIGHPTKTYRDFSKVFDALHDFKTSWQFKPNSVSAIKFSTFKNIVTNYAFLNDLGALPENTFDPWMKNITKAWRKTLDGYILFSSNGSPIGATKSFEYQFILYLSHENLLIAKKYRREIGFRRNSKYYGPYELINEYQHCEQSQGKSDRKTLICSSTPHLPSVLITISDDLKEIDVSYENGISSDKYYSTE